MEKQRNIANGTTEEKTKIDLSSVVEVILPNGHKYVKYVDLKRNIPVMLEINGTNKSAKEIIEGLQSASINYISNDAIYNTNGILELEKKYTRHELNIIPVEKMNSYSYLLKNLNQEQYQRINIFLKNYDKFYPKLKYINVDECLALDENNNVITCIYNKTTNQLDVKYADTVKYDVGEKTESNIMEGSIDGINFEAIIDTVEIENKAIEVQGYMIDKDMLEQYNNYPELLERKQMAPKEKNIWMCLLEAYRQRKSKKELTENPPKVLTKIQNKEKNAGFVNQNLMTFLSGFTVGIFFAIILFFAIKMFF